MRVGISQSNYIPWAGYFGLMARCDVFVFLDEVQFTSRDWRSRNKIKTAGGTKWLSIPVGDSISRRILDVKLPETNWKESHKSAILQAYKGAANFRHGEGLIELMYQESNSETLSEYNIKWTKYIATEILGLKINFMDSREVAHTGIGADRVLSICETLCASSYLSGPNGANYLDSHRFRSKGIELRFADYSGLPQYSQLHGNFDSKVSIVDMIMNIKSGYSDLIQISDFPK